MHGIILAAGYATRLYPLTKDQPKPLLSVGGKRMVEHLIEKMEDIPQLQTIHIITNDKFYLNFKRWADDYNSTKNIIIHNDGTVSNDDRLGAVGDIHFVLNKAGITDNALVVGGDNLFEFSLKDFINKYSEHKCCAVAARDLKDKSIIAGKYGVIDKSEDDFIKGFEEKPEMPKSTLTSTCIYMFNKEGISHLNNMIKENNGKVDNTGDLIKYLSDKTNVYCHSFDDKWFDVGSHEQLEEADKYFTHR
jgi:glucose-1-phosphate thymidylyltransferase